MADNGQSNKTPFVVAGVFFMMLGCLALVWAVGELWVIVRSNTTLGIYGFLTVGVGLLGTISLVLGARVAYNCLPLPNERVEFRMYHPGDRGQFWRNIRSVRYVEKKMRRLEEIEAQLEKLSITAGRAYFSLQESRGRIDYNRRKRIIAKQNQLGPALWVQRLELMEEIERDIRKIAAGDVNSLILELEERLRKAERLKQEVQLEVSQLQARPVADADETRSREKQMLTLRMAMKEVDFGIIETETDLKELRTFDFQKLGQELGIKGPPAATTASVDDLRDLKTKVDILREIQHPDEPAAKKRGRDDVERDIEDLDRADQELKSSQSLSEHDKIRRQNINANKREKLFEELEQLS